MSANKPSALIGVVIAALTLGAAVSTQAKAFQQGPGGQQGTPSPVAKPPAAKGPVDGEQEGRGGNSAITYFDSFFRANLADLQKLPYLREHILKVAALYNTLRISMVPDWEGSAQANYIRLVYQGNHPAAVEISETAPIYNSSYEEQKSKGPRDELLTLLSRITLGLSTIRQTNEITGAECLIRESRNTKDHQRLCVFFSTGLNPIIQATNLGDGRFPRASEVAMKISSLLKLRLRAVDQLPAPIAGAEIKNDAISYPDLLVTLVTRMFLGESSQELPSLLPIHEELVVIGLEKDNTYPLSNDISGRASWGIPTCDLPAGKTVTQTNAIFSFLRELNEKEQIKNGLSLGYDRPYKVRDFSYIRKATVDAVAQYCYAQAGIEVNRRGIKCPANANSCEWKGASTWLQYGWSEMPLTPGAKLHFNETSTFGNYVIWDAYCNTTLEATITEFVPAPRDEKCAVIAQTCEPKYRNNPNTIADDLKALDALKLANLCK